ncbi:MAG: hypothetical protein AAGF97_02335 [Planctomycetota bacterium]
MPPCWRPQDQVWLISTRHLPRSRFWSQRCRPTYRYYRYCPCDGWRCSNECEFLRSQHPHAMNTMYVHGNRCSRSEAREQGLCVYARLAVNAPRGRPIRHVIWSWPSREIPLRWAILRDARVKYRRTIPQGYYLGHWLARTGCTGRWTLLGYSYGARTVLNALQLRAGGSLKGICLPRRCHCHCDRYRVVLWAAATPRGWLTGCGQHECAFNCVQSGLVFYNPCDPVLRRFQCAICSAHTPALGLIGLPCRWSQICQLNASAVVGKSHSWKRYVNACSLMSCIRSYAYGW